MATTTTTAVPLWSPDAVQQSAYTGAETVVGLDNVERVAGRRLPQRLPASYTCAPLLPVRNQDRVDDCVAFASAAMLECLTRARAYLSPRYIYEHRQNYPASGMALLDAVNILTARGTCPDRLCASQAGESTAFGNSDQGCVGVAALDAAAAKHEVLAPFVVHDLSAAALKAALYALGPVIIGIQIYDDRAPGGAIWKPDAKVQQPRGGHCVCVVGWDDRRGALRVRNSWGAAWNDGGYAWMPYADVPAWVNECLGALARSPSSNCATEAFDAPPPPSPPTSRVVLLALLAGTGVILTLVVALLLLLLLSRR